MRITLLGHAALSIETAGQRIITDPYSSQIGYAPIHLGADIVTLSHDNPVYHSCLDELEGEFQVVQGMEILDGPVEIGGITFGAALVFERVPDDGPNAMVWFESEGIRVLHMGDCGVLPSDETLAKVGRIDVLLALTGGPPTISLPDLMVMVEKLQPRIVVPMHFGVPGLSMKALPVRAFEEAWSGAVVRQESGSLEIFSGELPQERELQILSTTRLRRSVEL